MVASVDVLPGLHRLGLHRQVTIPRFAPVPENPAANPPGSASFTRRSRYDSIPNQWTRAAVNSPSKIPLDRRPDLIDLAGPDYDVDIGEVGTKTLIICSAPRTGSYELCRFLLAAGLGIPFEYMHPQFATQIAPRWGMPAESLRGENIGAYIQALRLRRVQNGVFAVNLQYWHVSGYLMNGPGNALFTNAFVISLVRPDIAAQLTSWRVAMNTGIWDFSGRRTSEPREYPSEISARAAQFHEDLKFIAGEDAGFRELFALAGIKPLYLPMDDLFRAPGQIVSAIAEGLGVPVNESALANMIAGSKPYPRDEAAHARATEGLAVPLRHIAFGL
jgi:LPS sulfotransferase NodH